MIDFAFDNGLTVSNTIGADGKINDFPDPDNLCDNVARRKSAGGNLIG